MRIGIDLGGTKTEAVLMGPGSAILAAVSSATGANKNADPIHHNGHPLK